MDPSLRTVWRPITRISLRQRQRIGLKAHDLLRCGADKHPTRSFAAWEGAKREEDKRSFRGQLYESTTQRLQRERAEEDKYIEKRQQMGPGRAVQTFAMTIRTFKPQCGARLCYGCADTVVDEVGVCSLVLRRRQ